MPIIDNIHWDERLEGFKGNDTPAVILLLC